MLRKQLALAVFLGLLTLTTSCAPLLIAGGAAAGAGGAIWYKGKLEATVNGTIHEVRRATVAALKEHGLPVLTESRDGFVTMIESEISDGTRIWIKLSSVAASATKVNIRVGILGDRAKSTRILETIKKNLR
ncbi:MAG: DUF3568 family protein [Pseudomonadota bacterium]